MKKFHSIYDIKKVLIISICTMLIRYFYIEYYLFPEEGMKISHNDLCQLFFGGIPLEYSFDMIVISIHMIIIVLEVIVISYDLFNGLIDNIDILLSRVEKRKKMYWIFLSEVIKRDLILVCCNYLFFLVFVRKIPNIDDGIVMFSLFLLIFSLELIYFIFGFIFKNVFGYIVMLLFYFAPLLFIGFSFANGYSIWKVGQYFVLQYGNYNWFHKIFALYTEYDWEWESIVFTINFEYMSIIVQIFISMILLYIGQESFKKIRVI